jgi:hypothetical protein
MNDTLLLFPDHTQLFPEVGINPDEKPKRRKADPAEFLKTFPVKAAAPVEPESLSPAMRQYQQFKAQYPGYVLFFRMGDFYEMFWEDAKTAAKTLGVALALRNKGTANEIPMAGVPFHSVEPYLRKMIAAGHRVAICEQTQDDREVVRLMVPGTLPADPPVPPVTARSSRRPPVSEQVKKELEAAGIAFVSVDEAKRALFANAKLKAFHFVVYCPAGANWLVHCGEPTAAIRADMNQWASVFGEGYEVVHAVRRKAGIVYQSASG